MSLNDDAYKKPAWLTTMENGSIGEARTKALLLDRFWVLERSVDIEGADFIVQRRLPAPRLDSGRAMFGLVQAKFLQDTRTTAYIHPDYVLDEQGQPRDSFFLIAHTGTEDDQSMYFLKAKDVIGFDQVEEGKENAHKFRLPGTAVLVDQYRLKRSQILRKIEESLERADATKNRQYFRAYVRADDYDSVPLEINGHNCTRPATVDANEFDYLLGTLNEMKKRVAPLVPRLAYFINRGQELKDTLDPIEAASLASWLAYEYWDMPKEPFFSQSELNTHEPDVYVKQAINLAFEQKLDSEGWRAAYIGLRQSFRTALASCLSSLAPGTPARIESGYDANYLLAPLVTAQLNADLFFRASCRVNAGQRTIQLWLPADLTKRTANDALLEKLATLFDDEFQKEQVWSYKYDP